MFWFGFTKVFWLGWIKPSWLGANVHSDKVQCSSVTGFACFCFVKLLQAKNKYIDIEIVLELTYRIVSRFTRLSMLSISCSSVPTGKCKSEGVEVFLIHNVWPDRNCDLLGVWMVKARKQEKRVGRGTDRRLKEIRLWKNWCERRGEQGEQGEHHSHYNSSHTMLTC